MLDAARSLNPNERRLVEATEAYARDILDWNLVLEPAGPTGLPFHITSRYRLLEGSLFNTPCVFLLAAEDLETPAIIARHIDQVRAVFPQRPIIFVAEALDSHNRRRLIAKRIGFIVPHNQFFAPELAMDLREHFRARSPAPVDHLSPTSQLLVLGILNQGGLSSFIPSQLAQAFGCSAMSMGRAFDELQGIGLAQVAVHGRERRISFALKGRDLWTSAYPYLRSPVRKVRCLRGRPGDLPLLLAGESALARYTMLGYPRTDTFAAPASDLKSWGKIVDLPEADRGDPDAFALETWAYDPRVLERDGMVDPLSLYLSRQGETDERIQMACDELIEGFAW